MGESEIAVHVCQIRSQTVVFENGRCSLDCNEEDCPIIELDEMNHGGSHERSIHSGQRRK